MMAPSGEVSCALSSSAPSENNSSSARTYVPHVRRRAKQRVALAAPCHLLGRRWGKEVERDEVVNA
jgi:hypothetical protein